ncbi:MAG: D-alanine--D-alanine ligase [Deltaproteobacteria bacterium]|nr:D-alanine--D-alanine ligase [Deltaproteobacteria bacterium]
MTEKIRVAVLAGGWSGEREVSLKSGRAVCDALNKERYEVTMLDPRDDLKILIKTRAEIDLAFILLHGRFGEDGRIQGMLDVLRIPFVGSGVLGSALALNKRVAKNMYRRMGLCVADDIFLRRGERFSADGVMETLGSPVVIKPVCEGSSLGITIAHNEKEIRAGLEAAFQYDEEVMAEKHIQGREVTCCILGNEVLEALPLIEIVPTAGYRFFDYEAKYKPGATNEICPAPIPPSMAEKAYTYAKTAHRALDCRVWSRSDMIFQDDILYLLETNTIPGMTETSLFPLAARAAGMTLSDLLDKMIALSRDRLTS